MDFKGLDQLYHEFEERAEHMLGYPLPHCFDLSKLSRFLKFNLVNLGDPFLDGWNYKINTIKIERELVCQFAEMFHCPKDDFWGYVTNGGTEGNMFGLHLAIELYPDGIVYYSDQTHYSVPKSLRLLKIPHQKVKSLPNGEIDYEALRAQIIDEKHTPIIMANIGTTMTGAIDDVPKIKEILAQLKVHKYYIHCDAAFSGMILPFVSDPQPFDFRVGIDSIAISGHKILGMPIPCGVVLAKKSHLDEIGSHVEYVGTKDNTIPGSRSGFIPLCLWYQLKQYEKEGLTPLIQNCLDRADYLIKKFSEHGVEAWKNKNSITVVFPRPKEAIVQKWQLAVQGKIAHIITLPHVSEDIIDRFIGEVSSHGFD